MLSKKKLAIYSILLAQSMLLKRVRPRLLLDIVDHTQAVLHGAPFTG